MTELDLSGIDPTEAPESLAELHRRTKVGDPVQIRGLAAHPHPQVIIDGAGFAASPRAGAHGFVRLNTLADRVAPSLAVLVCGLNPSPASADSGIGFHRPGNRFWPAAIAAGMVSVDRDPDHALHTHRVGMTDIVKRTTRTAAEITSHEYGAGLDRLAQLTDWLQPEVVVMVGLAGWRAAVDRKAGRGWQPGRVGPTPVYVMPSTSGLNAHDTVDTLADHLRSALEGVPDSSWPSAEAD